VVGKASLVGVWVEEDFEEDTIRVMRLGNSYPPLSPFRLWHEPIVSLRHLSSYMESFDETPFRVTSGELSIRFEAMVDFGLEAGGEVFV